MACGAHQPVMLNEALAGLIVQEDGIYVDCTFGRGGHSRAILDKLGAQGRLLALDKDQAAVASREANELRTDARFSLEHGSFRNLQNFLEFRGWYGNSAGILMDLGVSSPQLDEAERGFSFLKEGPLDMRMNRKGGITAADWLAEVSEQELVAVLQRYGEERFARRIARAVVQRRKRQAIKTTRQLAEIIERAVPVRKRHKHPATQSFQAIRVLINDELSELEQGLNQAVGALKPGGRLVVITFHSLEDRIVKRFMRDESRPRIDPVTGLPSAYANSPRLKRIGKAQSPVDQEILTNPRARSAILRVAERREAACV
jgi:16S rRNA (cytosine1402-N4)-methyltransferase